MADATTLSTDAVPPGERAALWRDWMAKLFFGLESDLYGDTRFDGHVQTAHAGDVVMTRLEANRHRVIRRPQLARASDASYLKIVAPWHGCAAVEQHGRQAWASPAAGPSTTPPAATRWATPNVPNTSS